MSSNKDVMFFHGIGMCFFIREDIRKPRAGEFYIAPDKLYAYKAPYDLPDAHFIVKPVAYARPKSGYVRGLPIVN